MNKLENLPEFTDRVMNGLRADEKLKRKILNTVLQKEEPFFRTKPYRLVPVLLSVVSLMIVCVFLLNGKKPLSMNEEQHLIHSFSAGNNTSSAASFDAFFQTESDSVDSMELLSSGKLTDRDQLIRLMDLLKEHSEIISGDDIVMTDHLNIYGSSGLLFSLPAEKPYIGWSDGIRKCEMFFDSIGSLQD